jgi:hypothetical protein
MRSPVRTAAIPVSLFAVLAAVAPVWAQGGAGAASPAADTAALHIRDLSVLHALLPLKLTKAQIDSLITPLREIAKDDDARRKEDAAALAGLADDVAKARTAALNGEPPAKELEDKVAGRGKDAAARLASTRKAAILKLWPAVTALTDAQKDEIEAQSRAFYGGRRVPAQYQKDPSKAPKAEVQALALKAFIEGVLLDDRALGVLEKLKPAPEDAAAKPAASTAEAPAAAPAAKP